MSAKYFAQVFSKIHLNRNAPVKVGALPKRAKFIYRHHSSRNMQDLLSAMLKYSNNFIANQLFLMLPKNERKSSGFKRLSSAKALHSRRWKKNLVLKMPVLLMGRGYRV